MRAVVQRCNWCKITLENGEVSETGKGLVVLLGVGKEDNDNDVNYIADKVMNMRVFEDENQKMNRSLLDVEGSILSISQFTLYADCRKGRRPSFINAAKPDISSPLYDYFNECLRNQGIHVETGIFGADMKCALINDGPVTIVLDSDELIPHK